jgi:Zn-dependent protease
MLFTALGTNSLAFVAMIMALVYAITIHEFSHALAATWQGDPTARYQGRLSLNPLAHLDLLGSIMLLLAGFGWGKPVPVNPYNMRWQRWGEAAVSIAGPISNFISVVLFILIFKLTGPYLLPTNLLYIFLISLILTNLILGIFNLIPLPPLDGSKILFAALPSGFEKLKQQLTVNGPWILLALIMVDNFSTINIFGKIFDFFINFISRFL